MLNKELFTRDPTSFTIPNDGVTVVGDPQKPEEWEVLRYELSAFVCEGEYKDGLGRILSTFLGHLQQPKQPAVWVSGFYGSGKSHLVRVLQYLWNDITFPDDARARGLVRLSPEITDPLAELTTKGTQQGGLWAAAGKLGIGRCMQADILKILFLSAGLPVDYGAARLVIWMKTKGIYEAVAAEVARRGADLDFELANMYVSAELAEGIYAVYPGMADGPIAVSDKLLAEYPNQADLGNAEMTRTMKGVLQLQSRVPGKLPLALIVLDELQQSINEQPDRATAVQDIVEACTASFGSHILFVGTGQNALEATPQLSKLQDRFTVRVALEDKDVERVVREVVLRKAPDSLPNLEKVLDAASGEINRHLAGTKIGPVPGDKSVMAADYPLLPTRRRFWERTLRAIDRAGTAAQLRTQLRVVHDAVRDVALRPVGTVVGADLVYYQQKPAMLQGKVLLPEIAAAIEDLRKDGSPDGVLRSRLCALIFLIGELPAAGVAASGIRATPDTLADLLVEDLTAGSATLRGRIPALLTGMVAGGLLMEVDGAYRLQTQESREWQRAFSAHAAKIRADDAGIATDRGTVLRAALQSETKKLQPVQGVSKTPRRFELHFGPELPAATSDAVPVWVRDGWSISEKAFRDEAQAAGAGSPVVFVYLPRLQDAEFRAALVTMAAAIATLEAEPTPKTTQEGAEAHASMSSQLETAKSAADFCVGAVIANARVYQGGGNEVAEGSLKESVDAAIANALIRLFPSFKIADDAGWGKVVKRANEGAGDPLSALGFAGAAEDHPACKEVRTFLGSGKKKGSDVRKQFRAPGYGWSDDAIDGALLALVAGNSVLADRSGQPLTAKQIIQSQIGVTEFKNEKVIITTPQRLGVRKLIQGLGLPVKNGEEAQAIPLVLQKLVDLAADASGPPPLPEKPSVQALLDLQALGGNEQFAAVYERRDQLLALHKAWSNAKTAAAARQPRWDRLGRLLKHAGGRPIAGSTAPQVEAIRAQRLLLTEPEPVKPLLDALTADLRAAVKEARQKVVDARERELEALKGTAEWTKLSDEQWWDILHANGLGPIAELNAGTEDLLLATLDAKSLDAWATDALVVPTRMRQAREQAAKLLEPKAVRVRLRSTTLHNLDELDAYLAEARQEMAQHLEKGSPVIL
jgi:hypothetical protein